MISSGSTVFRFDLDIFSIGADLDRLAAVRACEPCAASAPGLDADLGGGQPGAVRAAIGLVDHHALREQAREGLVDAGMAGLASWRGMKKRE